MRTDVDPRITDAALAVAVALALAVVIAADPIGRDDLGGYAFAAGFGAALLARRQFPRALLVTTVLAVFVYYILDLPPVGMVLPAVGALFSGAERRHTGWAVGSAIVLLAVATFFRLNGETDAAFTGYSLVTEVALSAAAVALGAAVRLAYEARERSAEIVRLTEAEARHASDTRMQQERLRIARDLHDTIGHTLSIAALHAGVAGEETDPQKRRSALDRVRASASDALRELRRTVRFLRADDGPGADAPLGLARIDEIVTVVRDSGLEMRLALNHRDLPASVDGAAFRIVQESMTNVLRHADATSVWVATDTADDTLIVRVSDDGTPPQEVREGSGIRGMRERAALVGGTLIAGPSSSGFVVRARIPLTAAEET